MDYTARAYYELVVKVHFLSKRGNEFQNFFSEIMEKCHPGDFIRVRPWGNIGDRKNDGYLRSTRTLFQVYAPNEMTASEAVSKIDEDFNGALPYWQQYFDQWIFTHNSMDGLSAPVTDKLLELRQLHLQLDITSWGFEELRQRIFTLNDVDILSLLGPAPSNRNILELGFQDLQVVLLTIARQTPAVDADINPVPPNKIKANALSENVEILLNAGMRKAELVGQFFLRWHDPNFGDEVAETFKRKYQTLRASNMLPDMIFQELMIFAGGVQRGTADHEAAVLAVLAYLFEQCDIFEPPTTDVRS